MGIMCALGLASCISIGGASYSESDAFDIIYECDMARSAGYFSEVSFILVDGKYRFGMQDGYAMLEFLEEKGVDFRWKPKGNIPSQSYLAKYRKQELKFACDPFLSYR